VKRYLPLYRKMTKFYNSPKMKKMSDYLDKAKRGVIPLTLGEQDRAINAILKIVGATMDRKSDLKTAFVIGSADFGSDGIESSFAHLLVKKLKSLNYPVYYVDEYLTSQMCPKKGCQEKLAKTVFGSDGLRIKFCYNCQTMYHRDVMAGENMINVFLEMVNTGDLKARPKYLARPDKRGIICIYIRTY